MIIIMTDDAILCFFLLCKSNILTNLRVILLLERILYMNLPFFASFIVFLILVSYEISKSRRHMEKQRTSFWEREYMANNTRRKSLEHLNYITIPFDALPMDTMAEEGTVSECQQTLRSLSDSPIVNFTGLTNTDLKLMYGAPNIDLLMRYDQNYTTLACTLQKWADKLYVEGYVAEARQILEFSISTNTDVGNTYRLLASIYKAEGDADGIARLKACAEQLTPVAKNRIVRILQEFEP